MLCLWLSYCQVSWLVGLRASASLIFCCSGWYLFRYRLLSELCVLHRWLFRVIDVINLLLFACLTVLAVLGPITADYQWNCGFIHVSIESSLFLVHSLFLLSCSCRLQSVSIVPHIFLSLSLLLSRFLLRLRIQFLSLPWTYDSVTGIGRLLILNLLGSVFVSAVNIWLIVTFYTGSAAPNVTEWCVGKPMQKRNKSKGEKSSIL